MAREHTTVEIKQFCANTALVFLLDCADETDVFRLEFAPFDKDRQCMDGVKFYPIIQNGEEVLLKADNNPFTFITPAHGHYRITNMGYDDTRASVLLIDTYEVTPYVKR